MLFIEALMFFIINCKHYKIDIKACHIILIQTQYTDII